MIIRSIFLTLYDAIVVKIIQIINKILFFQCFPKCKLLFNHTFKSCDFFFMFLICGLLRNSKFFKCNSVLLKKSITGKIRLTDKKIRKNNSTLLCLTIDKYVTYKFHVTLTVLLMFFHSIISLFYSIIY